MTSNKDSILHELECHDAAAAVHDLAASDSMAKDGMARVVARR